MHHLGGFPVSDAGRVPGDQLSLWQRVRLVLVLGSLTALGPLTIDAYLPAFPAISENLAAAESAVQLTLTGTLIGLAMGQLLIGPLSDALGRRRPLIVAVSVHVVVSVLCAVAPNILTLGALRVLQGMAAAAGSVIAMAVVRDLFAGVSGVRLLSRLMLVTGVAPVLAPTLGAQLLRFTNWRGIFWALALIGAMLIVVVSVGLRETLPAERRRRGGVAGTVRTYGQLLRERRFVGLMLTGGLMMASLFAYISGSSFVFQGVYGLSEQQFGLMFGVNSIGLVIATQVNARVAVRYGPHRVVGTAVVVAAVAAAALLGAAATGAFGFLGVAVPLFVMLSTVGFTLPNVPVLALANHGRTAGTAAALVGSSYFVVGAVSAPLVGLFGTTSAVPMGAVMVVAALGAVVARHVVVGRRAAISTGDDRAGQPVVTQPTRIPAAEPAAEPTSRRAESRRGYLLVRAGMGRRRPRGTGPDQHGRRRVRQRSGGRSVA